MTELTQQDHGITSIITAIKTPLGFFVLVLLVGETCFVLIVKDLEGIDRTIAIIGMITMMAFACIAVYSLALKDRHSAYVQFFQQIEGAWWEKINYHQDSNLSFFSITRNVFGDVVLEGTSYDHDGQLCAYWKSEMVRLFPVERRLAYLWRGKHPLPDFAHLSFHGYGTMGFAPLMETSTQHDRGNGDFWDVDEAEPEKTIVKPVDLRRISNVDDTKCMIRGTAEEKSRIVLQTMKAW